MKKKTKTKNRTPEKAETVMTSEWGETEGRERGGRGGGGQMDHAAPFLCQYLKCAGVWSLESAGAKAEAEGRGLMPVVCSQHFFGAAMGLQGFHGVDILRQLRLASH